MGEEHEIGGFTQEDWEKVLKECERQFELMEKTKREMKFAKVCQEHLYKFAKKQLLKEKFK